MTSRSRTVTLGLGLLATAALAGCGGHGSEIAASIASPTTPATVPVTVTTLETRSVERTVEVVGTLKGWEEVTVGSKRIGRVVKIYHDMGDRVAPDEPLVLLETVDAELAVQQAERQLQAELAKLGLKEPPKDDFDVGTVPSVVQARVSLERARQNLARERSLMQRNAGTMQDLQNSENDERGAEAALASAMLTAQSTLANSQAARVALDVARQARADLEIRAPRATLLPPHTSEVMTYAVTKRSVSEGQFLKQGDPIMELVIEKPLRLWANVPEQHSAEVKVGQGVRVTVSSFPGVTFEGSVARINPSVDPVSRTFAVEALIPNNDGRLRPGGFAKASIVVDRTSEANVVPVESVVKMAGVTKIFIVEGDRSHSINVTTGLEGSGWVEVVGELPAGARVVTTGQSQLAEATPVVVRASEGETPETALASKKDSTSAKPNVP